MNDIHHPCNSLYMLHPYNSLVHTIEHHILGYIMSISPFCFIDFGFMPIDLSHFHPCFHVDVALQKKQHCAKLTVHLASVVVSLLNVHPYERITRKNEVEKVMKIGSQQQTLMKSRMARGRGIGRESTKTLKC